MGHHAALRPVNRAEYDDTVYGEPVIHTTIICHDEIP
jgi:hypothetical protein